MIFNKKRLIYTLITLIAGLIIFQLLCGKLFPFSPVTLGFKKHELKNTVVYVQNEAEVVNFDALDTLIKGVEEAHDLDFIRKPGIFFFKDSLNYIRHSPLTTRFGAFSSGRLFIAPWSVKEARQGKISMEVYVKHELSHVLIFQHKGFIGSSFYPAWLLEGIAVYTSEQLGTTHYPGKEETYQLIARGNFMPPGDFRTKREDRTKLEVKYKHAFMYSEFACIVDYLIESYGKEKFLSFMKALLDKNNFEEVFIEIYQLEFEKMLAEFKEHVYVKLK